MEKIRIFFERCKDSFLALPRPQKILALGSTFLLIGSLAYLAYTFNQVEYRPLYSELSEADLASVVQSLKEKKIPYKLTGSHAVSVPADKLYEIRLALAAEGLPRGSGVGFEIFDQQRLGSTEFVQRINYQRALQGELSRTINQMEEVQESRVHLVLPEESLFVEDQKPPRAAVFLKLRPGSKLGTRQLQAIANLVASAVEGLEPDNVTIMSTDGKIFYRKEKTDTPLEMTNYQLEVKNRLEENLRQKVQSMLARVVGADKVIAQVSVDLDFSRVEVAEDIYDPDSVVVRSQQRSIETSQGSGLNPRGNPDAPINIESRLLESSSAAPKQKTFSRQKETVNYEINRINRQIIRSPGSIKKISVAVVVDGPYKTEKTKDGKIEHIFVGRSPQELKALEDLVKKAVGYDDGRGDQVTVSNIAFAADHSAEALTPKPENKYLALFRQYQRVVFNVLLLILVFLFVVRPFMKRFQQIGQEPAEQEAPPALPEGAEEELLEGPKELPLRDQVIALVEENPSQAAQVIRAWMTEEA